MHTHALPNKLAHFFPPNTRARRSLMEPRLSWLKLQPRLASAKVPFPHHAMGFSQGREACRPADMQTSKAPPLVIRQNKGRSKRKTTSTVCSFLLPRPHTPHSLQRWFPVSVIQVLNGTNINVSCTSISNIFTVLLCLCFSPFISIFVALGC